MLLWDGFKTVERHTMEQRSSSCVCFCTFLREQRIISWVKTSAHYSCTLVASSRSFTPSMASPMSPASNLDADALVLFARLQERVIQLEAKNEELEQRFSTRAIEKNAAGAADFRAAKAEAVDEEPEASLYETADRSDVSNLFSFATETAMDSHSLSKIVTCLFYQTVLNATQILYSFGYYDASNLFFGLSTLPQFMSSMNLSLFYSTSVIPGTPLPLIKFLCSICSLTLLSLLMKNDMEGTLLTTSPLQVLLIGEGDHLRSAAEIRVLRDKPPTPLTKRIGRALLLMFLHSYLIARALLLPIYAGFGAAGNFAAAADAQEIVLNSVAIGFGE